MGACPTVTRRRDVIHAEFAFKSADGNFIGAIRGGCVGEMVSVKLVAPRVRERIFAG